MKKALNISIAQTLFTIEEDAYHKLEAYLQSIRQHFAKTEGQEDIMSDIESRISEQFLETKQSMITLTEVEAVMASMGEVKDFTDDDKQPDNQTDVVKKFYRNPDDKIVAGVCSGLGAYTDIDALWIRVAFVVLTIITSGAGIFFYILLALVIPEAKSASQKLEMQGEPVTLETMSNGLADKVHNFRAKNDSSIKALLAWPFTVLGEVVDFGVTYGGPALRGTTGIALALGGLVAILFLSVTAPLLLTNIDTYVDFPLTSIVTRPLLYVSIIGTYFTFFIPSLVLFLAGIGLTLKRQVLGLGLGFCMLFLWCIAIVGTGIAGANSAQRLEVYARTSPPYEQTTQEFSVDHQINSLIVSNDIEVTYIQGSEAQLIVTGRSRAVEHMVINEQSNTLILATDSSLPTCLFCANNDSLEVTLILPQLQRVEASMGSRFSAEDWTSEIPVTLNVSQGSQVIATVLAPEIEGLVNTGSHLILQADTATASIIADHGSHVGLLGASETITLQADQGSWIEGPEANLEVVEATANHGSHINLGQLETLTATARSGSHIEYLGQPIMDEYSDTSSRIERSDTVTNN